MKEWLDAIWGGFDKDEPAEWILLSFGWIVLILLLLVGNL